MVDMSPETLITLRLNGCCIGDQAACDLAQAIPKSMLAKLYVRDCNIQQRGAKALAHARLLTLLDLSDTSPEGAELVQILIITAADVLLTVIGR